MGAKPGPKTAAVNACSKVKLAYMTYPKSHFGPFLVYMARCPGKCSDVDPASLEFFKIQEEGLIETTPNRWASDKFIDQKFFWDVTIPCGIAPGEYVLRPELIAVPYASNKDGAQNFPYCVNLAVSSSGTDNPQGVKATELYKMDDPGILIDTSKPLKSYPIPGPPLYNGGSGSNNGTSESWSGSDYAAPSDSGSGYAAPSGTGSESGSAQPTGTIANGGGSGSGSGSGYDDKPATSPETSPAPLPANADDKCVAKTVTVSETVTITGDQSTPTPTPSPTPAGEQVNSKQQTEQPNEERSSQRQWGDYPQRDERQDRRHRSDYPQPQERPQRGDYPPRQDRPKWGDYPRRQERQQRGRGGYQVRRSL